jgi:tetratricopeptide (TPR) repeat protein
VSGPLFEQYRAALRRGHTSALEGRLEDALEAYREAARLVPERTLAFASQGTLLHKLDRWPEAAEAFDTALRLAPDDEASLRARGIARAERGMTSGAAADFERLAFVLDVAGRPAEAVEAAARASQLEPSVARAALAERLSRALREPPEAEQALGADHERDADATLEAGPSLEAGPTLDAGPAADAEDRAEDDVEGLPPPPRIVPETDAEAARRANAADPADSWPALDLPSAPTSIVGPPPDPEELMAEAAALYEAGDAAGAGEKMLTAVAVHRAAGRLDAALDVCFQLLAIEPGDPGVHLAIANLQLDRGWTPLAREKIDLLVRLTSLTGDTQAEADVHGLAAERLRDQPMASAGRR